MASGFVKDAHSIQRVIMVMDVQKTLAQRTRSHQMMDSARIVVMATQPPKMESHAINLCNKALL